MERSRKHHKGKDKAAIEEKEYEVEKMGSGVGRR